MHGINISKQRTCQRTIWRFDDDQMGFFIIMQLLLPLLPGIAQLIRLIRINGDMHSDNVF